MFGFGNNPDIGTANELGRQAHQAAQFMTYIQIKNELPPNKGEEALSLENEIERERIVSCFNDIIQENELSVILQPSATDCINQLAIDASHGGKPQLYENTLALMAVMNSINGVCKMYYVDFPKSKKLFALVNDLAKVCPPAIEKVFGDDMPTEYRKIWPHLLSIFEHHRANG